MCLLDWYKLRAENLEELCMSLGLLAVALLPGLTDPSHQRGGQLALSLYLYFSWTYPLVSPSI